jgi:membrane protease YdiL (CAAX protease family)
MLSSKTSLLEKMGVLLFELIPLAIKRFFLELKRAPLLFAFLIVSFSSTVYLFYGQFEPAGIGILVGVLACLVPALLAGIVFLFTKNYEAPEIDIKKPKFKLTVLIIYFLFLEIASTHGINGLNLSQHIPGSEALTRFFSTQLLQFLQHSFQMSGETAEGISGAVSQLILLVLIPLAVFKMIFKYRYRDMGISIRFWWLGVILMLIYTCTEFTGSLIFFGSAYLNRAFLLDFAFMLAYAGITEEFFFRGLMQPHFEKLSKNKLNGVVLTSIVFALAHVPIRIHMIGFEPLLVLTSCLGIPAIGALFAGYLYLKTRSLAPGALIHAWFDVSLFAFLSMSLG